MLGTRIVLKAGDGQRRFGIFRADHAVQVRAFLVLRVSLALDVLYPVDGLHRRVDIVLDVPEDDLVALRRKHQLLLISVRGVAADLLEGLRHHRVVGRNRFVRSRNTVHNDRLTGSFIQITNDVLYLCLPHIHKGEGIVFGLFDVNGDGMAAHLGEVAGLISLVQLRTGFCVEGLGRARQRAAGGGRRDLRAVLQLILDGIGHQRVGAPLGIKVQIAVYRHGEIKGFFLAGVADIEPTRKRVAAVMRVCRFGFCQCTMGNIIIRVQRVIPVIQRVLALVGFDSMCLARPLGIKNQIRGGHGQRAQVCLGAFVAARRRIPSGKHIGVRLKIGRVIRRKVVAAQRCFKLHAAALSLHLGVIVVERQIVAVAGIVQVVVFLHPHASTHWELRVGIPLCEAGDGVKFLGVGQACARTVCKIDHLVLLVVLPVKGGIARCPVQRFHVVVNLCAGFGGIFLKRDVFARHGIDRAEVVAGHKGLTPARHRPPDGFVSVLDGEIAVDIRSVFCRNGQVRCFITTIFMSMFSLPTCGRLCTASTCA